MPILAVLGYGVLLALMYFPDASSTAPAAAGLLQAAEVTLHSDDAEEIGTGEGNRALVFSLKAARKSNDFNEI